MPQKEKRKRILIKKLQKVKTSRKVKKVSKSLQVTKNKDLIKSHFYKEKVES